MLHWLIDTIDQHPRLQHGLPPAGMLAFAEQRQYAALRTPKRRVDWLLGRWTAKTLVQGVIYDQTGHEVPLCQIVIAKEASGAVCLPDFPNWHLSISHSHGRSLCVLTDYGAVGADIEQIESRSAEFIEDYFTFDEFCWVNGCYDDAERKILLNAVWSAKEAGLKALKLGLRVDTRALNCHGKAPTAQAWNTFQLTSDHRRLHVPPLYGWWRVYGEFVLTIASALPPP